MECPGCEKPILKTDKRFMVARDRPIYENILWHYDCWRLKIMGSPIKCPNCDDGLMYDGGSEWVCSSCNYRISK